MILGQIASRPESMFASSTKPDDQLEFHVHDEQSDFHAQSDDPSDDPSNESFQFFELGFGRILSKHFFDIEGFGDMEGPLRIQWPFNGVILNVGHHVTWHHISFLTVFYFPELTVPQKKNLVGRCISYWNSPFSWDI